MCRVPNDHQEGVMGNEGVTERGSTGRGTEDDVACSQSVGDKPRLE
jgi:hypothetical protein